MKIVFRKTFGGVLTPYTDFDSKKMQRFKNDEAYNVEIKLSRNPQFLAKAMVFFNFCMEHWDGEKVIEHSSPKAQFDRFRKDLTILAGYYEQTTRLDGSIRVEAKSLSFESMDEETFSECYHALIKAAIKHIFNGNDDSYYDQLISFF